MLKRIAVAASILVLAMIAVKDGRVLRDTGLTGSCTVVGTTNAGQLEGCRSGALEGFPDLSRHGCTGAGTSGAVEYWSCPAPLAADQASR